MSEQTPEPVAETPAAPEPPAEPAAPVAEEPSTFEKTKQPFFTRVRRDVVVEAQKVEGWFRSSDG